jgi:ppGpp synthetase/RelA/SpoT-type nucleotidyltranferase
MMPPVEAIRGTVRGGNDRPQDDLAGHVVTRYSKRQVVDAGKLIATRNSDVTPDLVAAFRIAHDWRGAHVRPMRRVQAELRNAARKIDEDAIIPARLKRMQSIRRKMQRRPMTLFQMQDIAGARAIMRNMAEVDRLLAFYRDGNSKFDVQREWDYIQAPKAGGYRSAHLRVVCPSEGDDDVYGRMAVELQVRSQLQHAWATAVEVVGSVTGEDLKSGIGNPEWLRFFELVASELACLEKRPIVPTTSERPEVRLKELRDVERELDAIHTLESFNSALRATDQIPIAPGALYMIALDKFGKTSVATYSRFSSMYTEYFRAERDKQDQNTVVVEVDRVDDLRRAYPNYFMDVRGFTARLKVILGNTSAADAAARPSKWAKYLSGLSAFPKAR